VPRGRGGREGHLGCGSVLGVGALEQSFCYDFRVCGVAHALLLAPSIRELLYCSRELRWRLRLRVVCARFRR
jgi:hypothetical protein